MNEIASLEFQLNLENQITEDIKEPCMVGYQFDEHTFLFTIMIPKEVFQ